MSSLDIGGIDAVRELYDLASHEAATAARQAEAAKQSQDYRAADRHNAYAKAMRKIEQRCTMIARERWLVDIRDRSQAARPS